VNAAGAFGKEVRALLPAFAATLVTIGLAAGADVHFRVRLILLLLCFGSIALGSISIGHEYSHRTLTLLLAQPRRRGELLMAKAAVLVPMVVAIAVAAALALPRNFIAASGGDVHALLVLAPLCALCLAPLLSMLCRSALAAMVFTVAIPGVFMALGEVMGFLLHGSTDPRAVDAYRLAFVWRGLSIVCAGGAAATWLVFNRLQAIEGHGELEAPRWLRRQPAARQVRRVHSPWASLFRKELRLQQLSFVVVALYLAGAMAAQALEVYAPDFPRVPVEALSLMYSGLLAVLIGAVASAEERQLGTLPSQLLQPVAPWKQWAVKAGTAIGLTLLLAIALPILVNQLIGSPEADLPTIRFIKRTLLPMTILTSLSLYVSSLSSSGVRAMVAALPVIIVTGLSGMIMSDFATRVVHRAYPLRWTAPDTREVITARAARLNWMSSLTDAAIIAGLLTLAATAVWLAFQNHRRIDRSPRAVVVQLGIFAAVLAVMAVVPGLIWFAFRPLD
jgi:ABC-type transport system involved in multi-copper enzyme maturation permease subunit